MDEAGRGEGSLDLWFCKGKGRMEKRVVGVSAFRACNMLQVQVQGCAAHITTSGKEICSQCLLLVGIGPQQAARVIDVAIALPAE